MQVEIQHITDPQAIMNLWPYLIQVPVVGMTHELVMGRAVAGDYTTIQGLLNGEFCGFMFYTADFKTSTITIVALFLPYHAREFISAFDDFCRSLGITKYIAYTPHSPEVFGRLFNLEHVFSMFSKEVL